MEYLICNPSELANEDQTFGSINFIANKMVYSSRISEYDVERSTVMTSLGVHLKMNVLLL